MTVLDKFIKNTAFNVTTMFFFAEFIVTCADGPSINNCRREINAQRKELGLSFFQQRAQNIHDSKDANGSH